MKHPVRDRLQRLICYYRWEFLRRNADFRRDFDGFCAQFTGWFESHGWWYDPAVRYNRAEIDYLHRNIAPTASGLQRRWDVGKLFPYDWQFDKLGRYELRPGVFVEQIGTGYFASSRYWVKLLGDVTRLTVEDLVFEYERRTEQSVHRPEAVLHLPDDSQYEEEFVPDEYWDRRVYLAVDIAFPLRFTVAKLESEIQQAKREYRAKYGKLKRQESHARRRFDDFDSYLRVWDLKKQGLTYAEVARRLFPKQHAEDRVKDHYRRAAELIQRGYREIE